MISVVINTLNEEANIADCISSVQRLADEVVVCDMHSTDNTVKIAEDLGARVAMVDADYCDFGRLRNYAVNQAQYEWVLVIDADERMTPALAAKLKQITDEDDVDVVYFSNLYWYFGGWVRHGIFFSNNWPRFFRRRVYLDCYHDSDEPIHDDLSAIREVENKVVLPKSYYLKHYAYPTIEKYIRKTLGMYARLEAEQMYQAGQRFNLWQLIWDPLKSFGKSFILLQGFRDGLRGFILTVLHAVFRFNIWANLWFLEETERQERQ